MSGEDRSTGEDRSKRFEISDKAKSIIGLCTVFSVAAGALYTYFSMYNIVPPKHFGVLVTLGEVKRETLDPGRHTRTPIISDFYTFSNNTIILEETVGAGKNTKDQNSYSARMRIHYKIKPDAGILAFHLDEMNKENGKELILGHMHKALDGVVGQRSVAESLISPPTVLSEFANQLDWRLAQNNIAIQVDTIEMLEQYVGSTNAGLRLPVQLKIRAGGPVESMSGPSVPVQHMEIVPRTLTP